MVLTDFLDEKIVSLNAKNYDALKEKVKQAKVTWILGAGVSVPAKLPQWDTLLTKMWARLSEIEPGPNAEMKEEAFVKACQEKLSQVNDYTKFREKVMAAYEGNGANIFSGLNLLESAEYMRNYIDDLVGNCNIIETREALQERILKALIRDSLNVGFDKDELVRSLSNEALGELTKLLAEKKSGRVITYNYDNLLEFCLEEIGHFKSDQVAVVCDNDLEKGDDENKINIHHPHGALKIVDTTLGKESRRIKLTESSYYEMEQKAYIWENSVQAKALIETSCIFLGFSGEDYNFRRIIKNVSTDADREMPKHYIFLCLNGLLNNVYKQEISKCHEEEYIYEQIQIINRLYAQYSYWGHHGIIPIWSTFEELPGMIKGLTM